MKMESVRYVEPKKEKPEAEEDFSPQYEEQVLDALHKCTDEKIGITPEAPERIQKDFEHCESYPIYEQYELGNMPRLDELGSTIKAVLDKVPENLKQDPEIAQTMKLLEGRQQIIARGVRNYVFSVIKFNRLHKLSAGGARDMTEQFVKADHERRRLHNSLLDSLKTLQTQLDKAEDLGICDKKDYSLWSPANPVPTPPGVINAFGPDAIANRDLIKMWAVAADFSEQFKKLNGMVDEQIKSPQDVPRA